jgi:putative tryptophan/tyrosine transport system substrate-binding protein
MRRREFITLLGGATACPLTARAQQWAIPMVGFLQPGTPDEQRITAFRKGLSEAGFIEGQNVAIEYRWARDDYSRLPELAADLVQRRVTVIAALGNAATVLAAKSSTTTIPVVFAFGGDPVQLGLVASFNRPGGSFTGLSLVNAELATKMIGLLHELLPGAARFTILVNPNNATVANIVSKDAQEAAPAIGRQIEIVSADTSNEIDAAFAGLKQKQIDAVMVAPDTLFYDRRVQLTTLATRHGLPAIYPTREFAVAGGLMTYGSNILDQYRLGGVYTRHILKGEKPAEMPIMRPTKFEFIINLQTAKIFGLTVPPTLFATADEVIE